MLKKIKKIGIIKTIMLNFKLFKFSEAIKFPILVSKNTKIELLKDSKIVVKTLKIGIIKIGFGDVGIFDFDRESTKIENKGTIVFNGYANIGFGSKIINEGYLEFGNDFVITAKTNIWCKKKIKFGKNVLISWDNLIMDTDAHHIIDRYSNSKLNDDGEINISDNVWIGCSSLILKNTFIGSNNIIAAKSKISGKFLEEYCIVGENLKVLKKNIIWK